MSVLKWGCLGLGLLVSAFALPANATVYNGMTIDQVVSALSASGDPVKKLSANVLLLKQGRRLILSSCQDTTGTCSEIYIIDEFSDVKPTLQGVNQWNTNYKAPEASVNDDGRLELTMFLSTIGLTEQLLLDTLTWLDSAEKQAYSYWQPYIKGPSS